MMTQTRATQRCLLCSSTASSKLDCEIHNSIPRPQYDSSMIRIDLQIFAESALACSVFKKSA